jgi:subtilisin family serine protease
MSKSTLSLAALCAALVTGCASNPSPRMPETALRAVQSGLSVEVRAQAQQQLVVTFRDERPALAIEAGATPTLRASRAGYAGSAYAQRIVNRLARDYQLERVTDWYIKTLGVHCVVYRLADGATRDATLAKLRADRRVADAQPMQEFRTLGKPNTERLAGTDPYADLQRATARIGVPAAQLHASGRGVRVAVIDTGMDDQHADLLGRIEVTGNYVDSDSEQYRRDRHGTAVGGTIAANSGNGAGIRGVAPEARLVSLKACWEIASDGSATCNSLTLASALESAIRRKVHVINLSLAGPPDRLLASLLRKAMEQGILIVGAAPSATDNASGGFPSNVVGVISVVNADAATADVNTVAAPGDEVLTLAPGGHYDYASGVSISTAMVSGVVALMLENAPGAGQRAEFIARLPALLRQTAEPRLARAPEINAARAIQAALP